MTAVTTQPAHSSRFPVLEKYDVLEELGHGGMATVYRAHDLRLGRDVAIKVIHPHLRDSTEAVRRFAIEAQAVAKLRHPSIVEVYDVSSASEREQYLVVELLRGITLRRLLETHHALPAEVAAAIGVELLAALAHAHEAGVIHRDVKPENVIIEHRVRRSPSDEPPPGASTPAGPPATTTPLPGGSHSSSEPGDRITIKLTDFGIAKLLDAQGVTSTGQVLGSPAHMAPEQIEGRDVDGRADVFGLGVLLYECLVGHLPFQGSNPAQVLRRVLEGEYASAEQEAPTVGRTWSRILDQALAPAVEARFAGALQMRDALLRELAHLGVTSPRGTIEAWFDDPPGFVRTHEATMTTRLCASGDEASRRGDVLAAAADYNRALAYAPNDPSLLKIVARMNRRSARRDVVRRTWPWAALALLVAGVGIEVAGARRAGPLSDAEHASAGPRPATPVAAPVDTTPTSSPPITPASARSLARPLVSARLLPRPAARHEVRFSDVEPAHGVRVSIDGAPPSPLDPSGALVLNEKAHTLTFSCASDFCEPITRAIAPGDGAITVPVRLTIKPARLVIRGLPGSHYFLDGDPKHTLESGETGNEIAMSQSAMRVVKVKELETGRLSQGVELRAGQSTVVEFGAP
jgi:serine/threonine-protein kinase